MLPQYKKWFEDWFAEWNQNPLKCATTTEKNLVEAGWEGGLRAAKAAPPVDFYTFLQRFAEAHGNSAGNIPNDKLGTLASRLSNAFGVGLQWKSITDFPKEDMFERSAGSGFWYSKEVLLWDDREGFAKGIVMMWYEDDAPHYIGKASGYHGYEFHRYAVVNNPED